MVEEETATGREAATADLASSPGLLQTHSSSLIEKVLEYRFLGAVTAELLKRNITFEVLRSDVDCNGYDPIIEANGVVRHIQLKAMAAGGKRANVTVNTRLAAKPSACVIWMLYDPDTFDLLSFRWFGSEPGTSLPDLGQRVARHSKANAEGVKAARPVQRIIPAGRFTRVDGVGALVDRLFGGGLSADEGFALLLRHLSGPPRDLGGPAWLDEVRGGDFEAIPEGLDWQGSINLAHMIAGYDLALEAGLGDGFGFAERQLAAARSSGTWPGTALELWISLYLEHRRWRFASPYEPDADMTALLDRLVQNLRRSLLETARHFDGRLDMKDRNDA